MLDNLLSYLYDSTPARLAGMAWRAFVRNATTLGVIGFLIVVISTFMSFVPIFDKSWRAGAVGFPVMLSCIAGIVLLLKRQYFPSFFIAIFAAFFLTHEIIIMYDSYAVEMGKELGPDGLFRLVFLVYQDAFQVQYGAFWALVGVLTALVGTSFGWGYNVMLLNKAAADALENGGVDGCVYYAPGTVGAEFPVEQWVENESRPIQGEDDEFDDDEDQEDDEFLLDDPEEDREPESK